MNDNPLLERVMRRCDSLEQENRRFKLVGVPVLVFLVVIFASQAFSQPQVVEAQRFLVRDPATGRSRAALSLLQDGSVGLSILGLDGKSLSLSADAGGNMGLTLYDKNRQLRAELFATGGGTSSLVLRDAAGKIIWKAP